MAVKVTVVDGTTPTGVYGPGPSINVRVLTSPSSPVGVYAPCGAYNVVMGLSKTAYHSSGAFNANDEGGGYYSFGMFRTLNDSASGLGSSNIFAPGDSITQGTGSEIANKTYPNAAANRLNVTKFPVARGLGGQSSTQIAARQGGVQILVSLSGAQIPASGGVAVTTKNINVLVNAGVFTGTMVGTIAGISGTMSTDSSGNWTFTRTSSGSITAVSNGSQFLPTEAVTFRDYDLWICAGTNNPTETDTVISDIDSMIAYAGHTRYRIISPLPSTAWSAGVLALYETLITQMRARYGAKFVDGRAALQAANDGSANDLLDIAAGYTPRSLRFDEVHLTSRGYEILGTAVASSYPISDQIITPDLGLATSWGEFDSATGWTLAAAYTISSGRMNRDATASSEAIRSSVPEIVSGRTYKATVRGYRSGLNLRNGAQYINLPLTDMSIQFTATASTFGFQTSGQMELLSVSIVEV